MRDSLAQLTIPGYGQIEPPPGIRAGGKDTLATIISVGIQLFLIVVIIAALGMLVWAGINWIRSSGDPQKIDAARMQIVYAVIGLVVALFSFALLNFFGGIFNVNLI